MHELVNSVLCQGRTASSHHFGFYELKLEIMFYLISLHDIFLPLFRSIKQDEVDNFLLRIYIKDAVRNVPILRQTFIFVPAHWTWAAHSIIHSTEDSNRPSATTMPWVRAKSMLFRQCSRNGSVFHFPPSYVYF